MTGTVLTAAIKDKLRGRKKVIELLTDYDIEEVRQRLQDLWVGAGHAKEGAAFLANKIKPIIIDFKDGAGKLDHQERRGLVIGQKAPNGKRLVVDGGTHMNETAVFDGFARVLEKCPELTGFLKENEICLVYTGHREQAIHYFDHVLDPAISFISAAEHETYRQQAGVNYNRVQAKALPVPVMTDGEEPERSGIAMYIGTPKVVIPGTPLHLQLLHGELQAIYNDADIIADGHTTSKDGGTMAMLYGRTLEQAQALAGLFAEMGAASVFTLPGLAVPSFYMCEMRSAQPDDNGSFQPGSGNITVLLESGRHLPKAGETDSGITATAMIAGLIKYFSGVEIAQRSRPGRHETTFYKDLYNVYTFNSPNVDHSKALTFPSLETLGQGKFDTTAHFITNKADLPQAVQLFLETHNLSTPEGQLDNGGAVNKGDVVLWTYWHGVDGSKQVVVATSPISGITTMARDNPEVSQGDGLAGNGDPYVLVEIYPDGESVESGL